MLTLSAAMQAKLDAAATTFCQCWRLTRNDGAVLGFTDHDRDLIFNGVTFRADTGLSASQLETNLGLAAGTAEASGALRDDGLTESDLLDGLYDGASVETWLVDWSNVDERVLLDVATMGDVRRGEHAFTAELRATAYVFDQQQGRAFQRGCAADLGDQRCGVDLAAFMSTGTVAGFSGGILTLDLPSVFKSAYFSGGALTFTSGANDGARVTIKSHSQDGLRASIALWTQPGGAIAAGDRVSLVAGCDKSAADCQQKFDNIVNFRGFPHMPGNYRVIAYPSALAPAMDGGSFFR